jgi:hypothetical protein
MDPTLTITYPVYVIDALCTFCAQGSYSWLLLSCFASKNWWADFGLILALVGSQRKWSCEFHFWSFTFGVSRDIAVSTAISYGLERSKGRSSSPGRVKNFLHVVQTGSGAHLASY